MGISVRNRLWDEWEGFFGRGHLSTRDDPLQKSNVFKASSLTDLKPSLAQRLSKMIKNRCPKGMFGGNRLWDDGDDFFEGCRSHRAMTRRTDDASMKV
jgi:hypothetical protein